MVKNIIAIDLGKIGQYSVNGGEDVIFYNTENGKKSGKFCKEAFIIEANKIIETIEDQGIEIAIVETGAGIMSKFSNRNFGFMEGVVQALITNYGTELIPVHITWVSAGRKELYRQGMEDDIDEVKKEVQIFLEGIIFLDKEQRKLYLDDEKKTLTGPKDQDAQQMYAYAKGKELI